jgi:hypothetical protein
MNRKSCQRQKYFKNESPTWRCELRKVCTEDCRHYMRRLRRPKRFPNG